MCCCNLKEDSHDPTNLQATALIGNCTELVWLLLMLFVLQEEKVFQAYDQISSAVKSDSYSKYNLMLW